ncbi:hypothetical protein [Castellaniella sp.]|uniref:hypothetical protein n=1 Tax=Castellaniella sp. TaxID=1955812 RepID=UPI00355F5083
MKMAREYLLGSLLALCCSPLPAHAQTAGHAARVASSVANVGQQVDEAGSNDSTPSGVPPADAGAGQAIRSWEMQSVHELMQDDLREAMDRPRPGSGVAAASGASPGAIDEPRLVALYGVGSALLAEVHVDRRAYLYVRGQAWPAGHFGDSGVFRLRDMNGACVQLERGTDRHSLCLRMLLGWGQP